MTKEAIDHIFNQARRGDVNFEEINSVHKIMDEFKIK